MHTGHPPLLEFLRDEIRRNGPMPFRRFMEQTLYHPEHGYYSSARCVIGREGDYFTNVSVGPLFGTLLAAQFAEIWRLLDKPNDFTIVEQGAHRAEFARDVLTAVRDEAPDFFASLTYEIIEPFSALETSQKESLSEFSDKVTWRKSVAELEPFCGVHFSNEFLDAMPVHLIVSGDKPSAGAPACGWQEKYVTDTSNGFGFVSGTISTAPLHDHLGKVPLPPGITYETEVNLAALDWMDEISRKLARGFIVTVDYGYARDQFYAPARNTGTLRARARHQIIPSPLLEVGNADITAHLDWTSIAERAEGSGLQLAGFTDQHHFLTGIISNPAAGDASAIARHSRALQTLLHPEFLGTTFQFLALSRDVDGGSDLMGFKFARNARSALALG